MVMRLNPKARLIEYKTLIIKRQQILFGEVGPLIEGKLVILLPYSATCNIVLGGL